MRVRGGIIVDCCDAVNCYLGILVVSNLVNSLSRVGSSEAAEIIALPQSARFRFGIGRASGSKRFDRAMVRAIWRRRGTAGPVRAVAIS